MGGSNSKLIERVAGQRIEILYRMAMASAEDNPGLSKSYVRTMQKMSTHYRHRLPAEVKNRICRACGSILVPGRNCSIRLCSSGGFIAVRCDCGKEKHIFYRSGKM